MKVTSLTENGLMIFLYLKEFKGMSNPQIFKPDIKKILFEVI
jgi:hypothetical protein